MVLWKKCHIGVDAFTGMVHTCEATSANVADIDVASKLLRKDDEVAYGDSAYQSLPKRDEIIEDENLSKIDFRTNTKKPYDGGIGCRRCRFEGICLCAPRDIKSSERSVT